MCDRWVWVGATGVLGLAAGACVPPQVTEGLGGSPSLRSRDLGSRVRAAHPGASPAPALPAPGTWRNWIVR